MVAKKISGEAPFAKVFFVNFAIVGFCQTFYRQSFLLYSIFGNTSGFGFPHTNVLKE